MPLIIQRSLLDIGERQRKDRPANAVSDLKASIKSKGLLHAPVVGHSAENPERFVLVCGETRMLAIDELAKDKQTFMHNGMTIMPGEVPVVRVTDLKPSDILEAELEENIIRTALSWQDRANAIASIHKLRQAENPRHTVRDTADEVSSKQSGTTSASGGFRQSISDDLVIAQHLHKPSVAAARNRNEALAIILKDESAKAEAILIQRKIIASASVEEPVRAILGSLFDILPSLDAGQFDLVVADPPYGIGADSAGFRSRTVQHHNYEDTKEVARDTLQTIVVEAFRLTKPRANLFVFGDIDMFSTFKLIASQMGWVPFRTPLHWVKSESEGLRPWGASGPARTVEWIFWATKGQKGLCQPITDVFTFKRVSRSDRVYGPEKPVELLEKLIEVSTMPGDYVLDPCCGAGSALAAARRLRRRALGIELAEEPFNFAVVRAAGEQPEPIQERMTLEELA